MVPPSRFFAICGWAGCVLGLLSACVGRQAIPHPVSSQPEALESPESSEAFKAAVAGYQDHFVLVLRDLSEIGRGKEVGVVRHRGILQWTADTLNQVQQAYDPEAPTVSLMRLWALTATAREYLQGPEGTRLFGRRQKEAINAVSSLELEAESLASKFAKPDAVARFKEKVSATARSEAETATPEQPESWGARGMRAVTSVVDIPLAPVRTASRIGEGAGSIKDFSATAERFTNVVEQLPEEIRLQLELLLLDLGDSDMVTSALMNLQELNVNSGRAVIVADNLPARVGEETRKVLDDMAAKQASFSALLRDMTTTTLEIRRTLEATNETAARIAETGRAWQATADSVGAASRELNALINPAPSNPPEKDSKPFDINDITRAALAITTGTRELRLLVSDLGSASRSGALNGPVDFTAQKTRETLKQTSRDVRDLINLAAWRVAELLVLAFVLAALFRLIGVRRKRPVS